MEFAALMYGRLDAYEYFHLLCLLPALFWFIVRLFFGPEN
jgi:hypothetical protein